MDDESLEEREREREERERGVDLGPR